MTRSRCCRIEQSSRSRFRSPHSSSKSWRDKVTNWISWSSLHWRICRDWSTSWLLQANQSWTRACLCFSSSTPPVWRIWNKVHIISVFREILLGKMVLTWGMLHLSSSVFLLDIDRGTTLFEFWWLVILPVLFSLPLKDICKSVIKTDRNTAGGLSSLLFFKYHELYR